MSNHDRDRAYFIVFSSHTHKRILWATNYSRTVGEQQDALAANPTRHAFYVAAHDATDALLKARLKFQRHGITDAVILHAEVFNGASFSTVIGG
jgi:hypothetical protein